MAVRTNDRTYHAIIVLLTYPTNTGKENTSLNVVVFCDCFRHGTCLIYVHIMSEPTRHTRCLVPIVKICTILEYRPLATLLIGLYRTARHSPDVKLKDISPNIYHNIPVAMLHACIKMISKL